MTLENIIDSYISGSVITLRAGDPNFDSNANSVLQNYFKNGFVGAVASKSSVDANTFTCQGTLNAASCSLYGGNSAVSFVLTFSQVGTAAISVVAVLAVAKNYQFSDSFPVLKLNSSDVLNAIIVNNITFTFSQGAVALEVNAANQGPLAKISWFESSTKFTGALTLQNLSATMQAPVFNLTATLANTQNLGFTGNFEVAFAVNLCAAVHVMANTFFTSSLYLEADLGTGDFTIPIAMPLYSGTGQYIVSLALNSPNGLPLANGFQDLSNFISAGAIDLPTDVFPVLNELVLTKASLALNPQTMKFFNFAIGVELNCSWSIFTDKFKLENISVNVCLPNLSQSNQVILSLDATFAIDGIDIDTNISLPDKTMYAKLANGSSIDINAFLSQLATGLSLPGSGDLTVNELSLNADITNSLYSFEAGIYGNWTIVSGFEIDALYLSLQCSQGMLSNVVFTTQLTLAEVIILDIVANYQSAGAGASSWNLSGQVEITKPFTISELLSGFGISITLPSGLADIALNNLGISYDSAQDEFEFQLGLAESFSFANIANVRGASSQECASLTLRTANSNGQRTSYIKAVIDAGLSFYDLTGTTISGFDPELDEIDITVNLASSGTTTSSQYTFATTFSNNNNATDKCIVTGSYDSSTSSSGNTTTSFGGNVTSQNPAGISLGNDFPIDMDIKDLFIADIKETPAGSSVPTKSIALFGSDISARGDFDLSSLPVLGDFLKEASFSFNSLRFVYNSVDILASDLTAVNGFLNDIGVAPLSVPQSTVANNSQSPASLPAGFNLQGSLMIGSDGKIIPLYSSFGGSAPALAATPTPLNPATSSSPTTPSPVGKKFGPITISSVSLGLSGGDISFTISGGLALGPLDLQFIGFKISNPIDSFDPSLAIHGLGLDLNNPPLTLDGLFLETDVTIPASGGNPATTISEYNGTISVGYNDYGLAALGSYAKLPSGGTSLFLYGFLGAPIGGLPVILYITGVAAGFGYNRAITLPTPENIASFPLISPTIPGNPPVSFTDMSNDFMPQEGAFWGAVGIRVESFKMVESFVLLCIQFNAELEIDLLGVANMQFPVPDVGSSVPPLAKIMIGIVARILPQQGIVAINGAFLPGSYIFCPEAVISGGFAFLGIFKNQTDGQWQGGQEGDFIITIGGYGPYFNPPTYYPQVPRLELNWRVCSALYVKAEAYFAFTPQALMVGGDLVGNFHEGGDFSIQVTFTIGADFIIYWKPYHYLGHIYADLDVSAHIDIDLWLFSIHESIDFDLGADLKIWGPSFAGHASVHVHIIVSFTVGISFGDSETTPQPISWSDFNAGFLPTAPTQILSTNIGSGLIASQSSADYQVVNAKELSITCASAVPIKIVSGIPGITAATTDFGIKPMANAVADFSSTFDVAIEKDGNDITQTYNEYFICSQITKNMPTALWQPADTSGVIPANSPNTLISNLLTGINLVPQPPILGNSATAPAASEDLINMPSSQFAPKFQYSAANFANTIN